VNQPLFRAGKATAQKAKNAHEKKALLREVMTS